MQTTGCKYGVLAGLLFFVSLSLGAQEREELIAYHASGPDFSLNTAGERKIYSAEAIAAAGLALTPGDLIQTGSGSFLELQLLPSGTLIKVSENTTFVFNGFDAAGRFADLGLLYGRIRLVTGTAAESKTAVVRAANFSVRLEEGDLGVDYVLEPLFQSRGGGSQPLLCLYGFSGEAEVFPFPAGGSSLQAGGIQSIGVREREALFLTIASPMIYTERKPLERGIADFWSQHNFSGIPPASMPSVALPDIAPEPLLSGGPVETPPQALPEAALPTDYFALARSRQVKNTVLVTGLFLTAASVVVQSVSYFQFDTGRDVLARNAFAAAYAPMGLGIITVLTGIMYNPRIASP